MPVTIGNPAQDPDHALNPPPGDITIIIPTRNALRYLPGCVESIRQQLGSLLGQGVHVMVRDAGSSDGSQEYLAELDLPGLSSKSQPDKGIYDAMNTAVAEAGSDWVFFLGADDRLLPGFAEALARLEDRNAVYYGDVVLTSNGRRYDGRFSPLKLVYRNICHQAMFFPAALLRSSPFDVRYRTHADWAKNIELMASHEFRYLDLPIARYRDRSGASGTLEDSAFAADKATLVRRHHGLLLSLCSLTAPLPTTLYHWLSGRARHQ